MSLFVYFSVSALLQMGQTDSNKVMTQLPFQTLIQGQRQDYDRLLYVLPCVFYKVYLGTYQTQHFNSMYPGNIDLLCMQFGFNFLLVR